MQNRCKTIKLYGTATGAVYILLAAPAGGLCGPGTTSGAYVRGTAHPGSVAR
jgi:hypothetical protein